MYVSKRSEKDKMVVSETVDPPLKPRHLLPRGNFGDSASSNSAGQGNPFI